MSTFDTDRPSTRSYVVRAAQVDCKTSKLSRSGNSMTVRYDCKPCYTEAGLLQIWRDGKSTTSGCRSGMAAAVRLQICQDGSRLPAQLDRRTIRAAAVFTRRYSTLYFSSSSCSAVSPVNSVTCSPDIPDASSFLAIASFPLTSPSTSPAERPSARPRSIPLASPSASPCSLAVASMF